MRAQAPPVEWTETLNSRGKSSTRPQNRRIAPDRRIAELAEAQHNVVGFDQLRDLGLSENAVFYRASTGRLHRIHSRAFAVGSPLLTREGHWLAAVIASGPGAVLSHRSAAALHGLLNDSRAVIDVCAPNRCGRSVAGFRAHACSLAAADATVAESIPCTTVARTLLDLAAVVREESLRAAFRKAEILRVLDVREVEAAAGRVSRPRGVVALRRVIADFDPELLYTESAMEGRFLELCRTSGLPVPEANVPLVVGNESFRPDFLWRRERLIIELDSSRFHSTPSGVERDKRRDQALLLAGWTTVRVTESQLRDEPILLASKTAQLLAQRRVDGDPKQRSSGRKP